MSGVLYVVGTPIGNLGDLTLRAVEVLRNTPHLAAEDTRRARALLAHLGIQSKRLHRFDAHATPRDLEKLLVLLEGGEDVALVSDAGMPSVSDPGAELVKTATARSISVVAVPGPSAVTAAVAVSGLVSTSFYFVGFLPRQGKKRRLLLARIASFPEPIVLFEAPGRVHGTLGDLAQLMPERPAALCRELTKLHEQVVGGTLSELSMVETQWRGEVTIVIGADEHAAPAKVAARAEDVETQIVARLAEGMSPKTIAAEVATLSGLPRRKVYAAVLAVKASLGER